MTERELQQEIDQLKQLIADDTAALQSKALPDDDRRLLQNVMTGRATRIERLEDQLLAVRMNRRPPDNNG